MYSTDVNFIASQALARSQQQHGEGSNGAAAASTTTTTTTSTTTTDDKALDAMVALERQTRAPIGFVAAGIGLAGSAPATATQPVASNPDAIDVNVDDL